jgi:hypothetical protein
VTPSHTNFLAGYPPDVQAQVQALLAQDQLGALLLRKHPGPVHGVRTDTALYAYVMDLKNSFLRSSEPLSKVAYDNKLHVIHHALGKRTIADGEVVGVGMRRGKHDVCAPAFQVEAAIDI